MTASARQSERRQRLWRGVEKLINDLQAIIPSLELLVDGSFLTEKPNPEDIDMAVFIAAESVNTLSAEDYDELIRLTQRDFTRARYGIDLYTEQLGDPHRKAYWRGLFGFYRDGVTPKGIAWIKINP